MALWTELIMLRRETLTPECGRLTLTWDWPLSEQGPA
jgi:hypothetical protein